MIDNNGVQSDIGLSLCDDNTAAYCSVCVVRF